MLVLAWPVVHVSQAVKGAVRPEGFTLDSLRHMNGPSTVARMAGPAILAMNGFVGWVERSDTHHLAFSRGAYR